MELEWEDPPAKGYAKGQGRTARFVAELQKRPGEWAKYPVTVRHGSTGSTYRKLYPTVEWTTRRRPDGRFDLYGHWIGDQS